MIEHIQINDIAPRVQYLADGIQSAFTFPFAIFKPTDLEVWLDDARQTSGYAVSGAGVSSGGVALFAVPPAADTRITLRRRLTIARTSDYQSDGLIRAKTLNDELDYQVAALQQVAEDVDRTVRRAPTALAAIDLTLPEPVAGRGLKWSADGSRLINSTNDPDAVGDASHAASQAMAAAAIAVQARDAALAAVESVSDPLTRAANLLDLPDTELARANLGLGDAALRNVGTAAGDVVALDVSGLIAAALLPPIESIPVGTIVAYGGVTVPAGWLLCDGATVSRSTYSGLFGALGVTYGSGDGATTFTLPDLRGRAAIGAGQGVPLSNRTLGQKLGAETHTLTVAEMPSHSHSFGGGYASEFGGYNSQALTPTSATTGSSGGNGAHNNMPPSLVLNFIVKF